MKRRIGKVKKVLWMLGFVAGISTGCTTIAAETETESDAVSEAELGVGATGALNDHEYSLEKMLIYAIEDEYLAQTEYSVIMEEYGEQRPFSNIIKAEANHISLLIPLFQEYDVEIPERDWESLVVLPESLVQAYVIGVEAEENNIAMYETFLKEEIPDDVKEVFEKLKEASEKHLAAFERQVDAGSETAKNESNHNGSGHGRNRQ